MPAPTQFGRRGVATAAPAPAYGAAPRATQSPPPRSGAPAGPSALGPLLHFFFSYSGRIRRRDYWLGHLSVTVLMFAGLWFEVSMRDAAKDNLLGLLLLLPYSFALPVVFLWSALAIQVKRWHDRGKSWPWLFIGFIPLIGGLWVFVELGCLDGDAGDNQFGHSPKWSPDLAFA